MKEPVAAYIAQFSPAVQKILQTLHRTILAELPGAEEVISYKMPAFRLHGRTVIWYAAWKEHIGLYPPVPAELSATVKRYAGPKGNLQFPLAEPLPLTLISAIARSQARRASGKRGEKSTVTKTVVKKKSAGRRTSGSPKKSRR